MTPTKALEYMRRHAMAEVRLKDAMIFNQANSVLVKVIAEWEKLSKDSIGSKVDATPAPDPSADDPA